MPNLGLTEEQAAAIRDYLAGAGEVRTSSRGTTERVRDAVASKRFAFGFAVGAAGTLAALSALWLVRRRGWI